MEMKELSGTIGKNRYPKGDKSPQLSGRCLIAGKKYWINGWKKASSVDGSIFYSLSFKPTDEAAQMDPVTGEGQADSPGF